MNHELAKELKEAGFAQSINCGHCGYDFYREAYVPTLSELIEACGDKFGLMIKDRSGWMCLTNSIGPSGFSKTPEEAVARLWLTLNKK